MNPTYQLKVIYCDAKSHDNKMHVLLKLKHLGGHNLFTLLINSNIYTIFKNKHEKFKEQELNCVNNRIS